MKVAEASVTETEWRSGLDDPNLAVTHLMRIYVQTDT